MIVPVYTDGLMYFYRNYSNFHHLLFIMFTWTPCTPQEGQVLKFLNVRIVKSKHDISFDQTSHTKKTIVDVWFQNTNYLLGMCDTHSKQTPPMKESL